MRRQRQEKNHANQNRKPEDAREESYTMVACLVYYRTTAPCWAVKARPKLALGLGVGRSIVLSSSEDSA
jgi:hypothetical protein